MTDFDSESWLAIELQPVQWTPLYFETEDDARDAVKGRDPLTVYWTSDGKSVYHEADKKRFVIFVKETQE